MRIDSIHIENLASLLGSQQVIDLRAGGPAVGGAGIIAITGVTGAGKSTILDAICLALYNQTPRQRRNHGAAALLLNNFATHAAVTVELSLDDGNRWRVLWSIRRPRGRLGNEPMAPERSIIDAATGTILASGIAEVDRYVAQRLRLDFTQFSRTVILAQSDFAQFLHASDHERAELLQLLTGTEIYARIGALAFSRFRESEQAHQQVVDQMQGVQVLPLDALQELVQLAEEKSAAATHLNSIAALLREKFTTVENWVASENTLQASKSQLAEVERRSVDSSTQRTELERADHAAGGAAIHLEWQSARDAHQQTVCKLDRQELTLQQLLTDARTAADDAWVRLGQATSVMQQLRDKVLKAKPWAAIPTEQIDGYRHHQQSISAQRTELALLEATLEADRARLVNDITSMRTNEKLAIEHGDSLATALEQIAGASEAVNLAREGRLDGDWQAERQQLDAAIALLNGEIPDLGPLQSAKDLAAVRRESVQRALIDKEAERSAESLRLDDLRKLETRAAEVAGLSAYVHLIEEGKPCPLCGSSEHPQIQRASDALHAQIRTDLNQQVAKISECDDQLTRLRGNLALSDGTILSATRELQNKSAARERIMVSWKPISIALKLGIDPNQSQIEQLVIRREKILTRLRKIAEAEKTYVAADRTVTQLQTQYEGIRKEIERQAQETGSAKESIVRRESSCNERSAAVKSQTNILHKTLSILAESLNTPVPDASNIETFITKLDRYRGEAIQCIAMASECSRQLEDAYNHAQSLVPAGAKLEVSLGGDAKDIESSLRALELAIRTASAVSGHVKAAKQTLANIRERLAREAIAAIASHEKLSETLVQLGYGTVIELQRDLRDETARTTLRKTITEVDRDLATARARFKQSIEVKEAHEAKVLALHLDPSHPSLSTHIESDLLSTIEAATEADRDATRLREQIRVDGEGRSRYETLKNQCDLLQIARSRAERLKTLIGDADGKRFNRLAQVYTLDVLLELANHRLTQLEPRYQLQRTRVIGEAQPGLGISVIDRDQADTIRSITTLSGGETFLVSLALAISLADLQRGRMRIGTLCIDEGFGSLDECTLTKALSTLERLQQRDGTQILLISHIGALHDRISNRIEVLRRAPGISWIRLTGPDGTVGTPPALPQRATSDANDGTDVDRLLAEIRTRQSMNSTEVQEYLGRDASKVREFIKVLKDRGVIVATGAARATRYSAI